MTKYKIKRFDRPIRKSYKDVKKYDVERFEYGDDGNIGEAVILSIKHYDENTLEVFYSTENGRFFKG